VPFPDVSAAMEAYYREKDSASRIRQRSADLRHILQLALERTSRKLDLQRKQLKDTEKRDKFRLYGELLQANAWQIEAGQTSVTLENFYEEGKTITVPLDETLSAQENAQRYFERYQKLKRTREATLTQIEESESELAYLQSVSQALALAETEEDLAGIKAELAATGFVKAQRRGKKDKAPKAGKPLHFVSSEGFDFYVGKNNLQNEELSFSFASGNDWWFHLKGRPGSHVIVKTGGRELTDRGFEEAAALAAWYSAAQKEEKAEVDYTRRKELKKPAAYKPGLVIYHTNYSMVVTPSLEGLTNA
jgi:predicted ribosome quality control (RQC) complex YloA/Tae2 family protein